jgi:aminocarboxymuconate-semialdehyde decarboxylase
MKLDIYNHVWPPLFVEHLKRGGTEHPLLKRVLKFQNLYDMDARRRLMDRYDGYCQVLSMAGPPIEDFGPPDKSLEFARVANDGLAELCRKYPDRFPGFIASLPMNNPQAAVTEIGRAIDQLGACGVQIFSNVLGRPLDEPEFFPIFAETAARDLPIWLHPIRPASFADYPTETKSKYEIWFMFGWPYETSAAMARLVFSGLFDKLPDIKVIAHHMGAMLPFFAERLSTGYDELGSRSPGEGYEELLASMKKRPVDYFRMFHADTALFGARAATLCGLDFFGADQCLFATDFPFDPEGGELFVRDTIRVLDSLDIAETDRAKLYQANARRLLRLSS